MPVKRELWNMPLSKEIIPAWRCPTCHDGYLFLKPDTFRFAETSESRKAEGLNGWHPDDATYRFSALLECSNRSCLEVVAISGLGYGFHEETLSFNHDSEEYETDSVYVEQFYPKHVNPSPSLITIPDDCPEDLSFELRKAFIAFWGDHHAAINHIHSSIELLMDYLGEARKRVDDNGIEERIDLYKRIMNF